MKQGKLKIIGATIVTIAVIFTAIFLGIHQNFDNNDIQTANKPVDKVSASKKHSKAKHKASHQSLYLQDAEKPDRILAIHPHGTDGIFQYRKDANGSIYPEQEFFKGDVSLKGNKISIKPDDSYSSAKGFNLKKQSDGKVVDVDSGHVYDGFKPDKQNDGGESKIAHVDKQPQHNADYVDSSTGPRNVAYMLDNGDFYNPYLHIYYGPGDGYKSFDPTTFDPSKYADDHNIMSGNINGQTDIGARNILEQKNWAIASQYPHQLSF